MAYKKSQFGQDDWVLEHFQSGYFVEAGAADGLENSNSYRLEKMGWKGICCEPHPVLFEQLKRNRNCHVDGRCLYNKSGFMIDFSLDRCQTWSGIGNYFKDSLHRHLMEVVAVETVNLSDLLLFYDAPTNIEYLSLDTEGSELIILQAFDLSQYNIKLISVEHNHVEDKRKEIRDLLESNNYRFVQSKEMDDWYEKEQI